MNKTRIDTLAFHFPYITNTCPSWKNVLSLATPYSIEKNQNLIDIEGDKLNFYFIEDGILQIKYYSSQGKIRGLTCFGKNSLISLATSCLQLDNLTSSVHCIRKGKVWKFDSALLSDIKFMQQYPLLLQEALKQLSANLLIHITYTTNMLLEPAYERTIFYLLALSKEREKNTILPRFTQQEMAEMLNLHRVTFVNALQRLKEEGLIEVQRQQEIKILDIVALKKIVIPF